MLKNIFKLIIWISRWWKINLLMPKNLLKVREKIQKRVKQKIKNNKIISYNYILLEIL
jgi:hypothetical protein